MNALGKVPIRLRLTLAFAAAMAGLLTAIALALYVGMGAVLLDEIDTGLRARAVALATDLPRPKLAAPTHGLIEAREAFAQVLDSVGGVIDTSPGLTAPLLPAGLLNVRHSVFVERLVPGVDDVARLLVVPVRDRLGPLVLIVGTSMTDRADALGTLTIFFTIAGSVALLLASGVGWLVAGSALKPVERMRRQASEISASGIDRRLTAPLANDEIRRLAETLNEMLSRLELAMEHERRFVDDASHELRTPLTALKAELDLARSRPRSIEDLSAALSSASDETDRLARLADDLLLLSRRHNGRVGLRRQDTSLRELVDASARAFTPLARAAGIRIVTDAPDAHAVIDGVRVRQAIDNLLDNAIRHSRRGGDVHLLAAIEDGAVRIAVEDEGPGFTADFLPDAFEPFRRATPRDNRLEGGLGAGLGLAIVQSIAESHGGFVTAENRPQGGARVLLVISPDAAREIRP